MYSKYVKAFSGNGSIKGMYLLLLLLLTPWSGVLLEKLTVTQLIKKCPAFYGTRRLITVFTRARK
jgi:hypothetical protein